jgi:hypothetical protein
LTDSKGKGKTIPLQALTAPEGSRRLRLPDLTNSTLNILDIISAEEADNKENSTTASCLFKS